MKHFKHPLCNGVLTAAPGTEEHVDALHVQFGSRDGHRCVRSFWKPNELELRCLNEGSCVVLSVLGVSAPAVALEVPNPEQGVDLSEAFGHDETLLQEMVLEAHDRVWIDPHVQDMIKDIAKTYAMTMLRRYG